ncbi:MAG TPA: sigma 54-interacting transcriptional regulator, partial [Candidatus Acidoferrum sp.]|nr:sigma 54-interacting transcriptional regulator [Candidatus Acidoferrum sp.]
GAARSWSRCDRQLAISIPDAEMSRLHVRLTRGDRGWTVHDLGSKNGTRVGGLRATRRGLVDGDLVEVGGSLLMYRDRPAPGGDTGDRDLAAQGRVPEVFRTLSLELERRVLELVRIAPTAVPVLVVGETGTGKELVAEAIHALSRRSGPFVPLNCGALPQSLVESELFGHRRGAFSGAHDDRIGLARKADGGTLFLDEVAELPEESQSALLRLLLQGEVRPLGSSDVIRVNARVVAATHQDLAARVADGRFRRDLYGRLAGYEMAMPPLRDRREDIGSLIATLLARRGVTGPRFSVQPRAAVALFAHDYPMNVRELEQALGSAMALAEREEIGLEHLPQAIRAAVRSSHTSLGAEEAARRAELVRLLRQTQGNVTATARALDKAPVQIRRWLRRFAIDLNEYRR